MLRLTVTFPLIAACLLHSASPARAGGDTHYQDSVIGERAAGMGGAYTAIASDATGPYYNPAGLVVSGSTIIELSMSAYKVRLKKTQIADICGTTLSDDQSAFFTFPAAFGFAKLFQTGNVRHAVGISLAIPHSEKFTHATEGLGINCGPVTTDIGFSQLSVDRTFIGGLNYAIQPVTWLKLGMSLGFGVRSVTFTRMVASTAQLSGFDFAPGVSFLHGDTTLWNLFAQFGALIVLPKGFQVGLSVTTPHISLANSGTLDVADSDLNEALIPEVNAFSAEDAQFHWRVPLAINLGVAYLKPRDYTLALDLRFHAPVSAYDQVTHPSLPPGEISVNERRTVVNLNIGGEWFVAHTVVLRGGFFTNFTSFPDLAVGRFDDFDSIDLFGFTFGGSWHAAEDSILSAALQIQFGSGETARARVDLDPNNSDGGATNTVVAGDVSEFSLIASVGGRFDLE